MPFLPMPRVLEQEGQSLSPEQLREMREALAWQVTVTVRALRLQGVDWGVIAGRIGMSKTTAWRHYRQVDGFAVGVVRGPDGARYECLETGLTFRSTDDLLLDDGQTVRLAEWARAAAVDVDLVEGPA